MEIIRWLFYYRRGKPYVRVFDFGNTYMATATDGETTVWNCYGSTPESAKELALWRLRKINNPDPNGVTVKSRQF